MSEQIKLAVAGQFGMLTGQRQRELLRNVISNMWERGENDERSGNDEAWHEVAQFLIDQLGANDAMIAVQD